MISRIFRGDDEHAAVKRKRQIDTLKIFNDNVVELREDSEYQIQFNAGDKRMAIIVSLSSEFPLEKPVLKVSPSVTHHPWCNDQSEIISAPGLMNFTVHSDLGRVVQAIIREFSKNPPSQSHEETMLASNTSNLGEIQQNGTLLCGLQRYPHLYPVDYNSSCYNYHDSKYSSCNTNICEYSYINTCCAPDAEQAAFPSTLNHPQSIQTLNQSPIYAMSNLEFPELNCLSNEKLIKLDEEEDEDNKCRDAFLDECSRLDDIHSSIDETIDFVEVIANDNLARETELKTLQNEVALKIRTVSELKTRYDNLICQYNKMSAAFAPDHIRECLKYAADDSHEQSEKIAEDFLEQKIDVERFVSTYIECRKLGQTRRTKEEKLAHQLNEFKRAGY